MDVIEYILSKNRNDYQKDNFDDFIDKTRFFFDISAIHIAGTNGKGSAATFLKDIYVSNGYKVGLFTSPDDICEMIKINDEPISVEYIEKIVNEYKKLIEKYDLSTFEIETFVALNYFKDQKVDIAIIECGMGGELDATNIFTPVLSVITSIDIEHSEFLGVSMSAIALHKAGIIKNEIPTLIGKIEGDALDVIVDRCKEEKSKLYILDRYHHLSIDNGQAHFSYRPYESLSIDSPAEYRVEDACLAIESTNILKNTFPITEENLLKGLLRSKLKCRFEFGKGQPQIVLDGAHNPHGMKQLRMDCDRNFAGRNIHVVFASFRDKNIALMLPEISLIGDVHLTTFDNGRARDDSDYFLYLEDYSYNADYKELLNSLINEYPEDIILVTGSLTFTFEVRKYLKEKGFYD